MFLRFISTTLLKFMFRNFYVKKQHYTVLYQNQVIYTATLQDACFVKVFTFKTLAQNLLANQL